MKEKFSKTQLTAIENLGCSISSYERYIRTFKERYCESDITISGLIAGKQFEEAMQFAHSIKGLTATLGLLEISESAHDIEELLHKLQDTGKSSETYSHELQKALKSYEKSLSDFKR